MARPLERHPRIAGGGGIRGPHLDQVLDGEFVTMEHADLVAVGQMAVGTDGTPRRNPRATRSGTCRTPGGAGGRSRPSRPWISGNSSPCSHLVRTAGASCASELSIPDHSAAATGEPARHVAGAVAESIAPLPGGPRAAREDRNAPDAHAGAPPAQARADLRVVFRPTVPKLPVSPEVLGATRPASPHYVGLDGWREWTAAPRWTQRRGHLPRASLLSAACVVVPSREPTSSMATPHPSSRRDGIGRGPPKNKKAAADGGIPPSPRQPPVCPAGPA